MVGVHIKHNLTGRIFPFLIVLPTVLMGGTAWVAPFIESNCTARYAGYDIIKQQMLSRKYNLGCFFKGQIITYNKFAHLKKK